MKKRILLVSERSGGHVYPALAVGEKIGRNIPGNEIFFFTSSSFFKKHIKSKGYPVFGTAFSFRNIFIEFFWRAWEALYILLKVRPALVIGFGGRDSFCLTLFSCLLAKKTFIYEPNVKMGKSNRALSRFVKVIFRGLPPSEKSKKEKIVGVVLEEKMLLKVNKNQALQNLDFNRDPVVLCFGGSQGASFINNNFMRFAGRHNQKPYQIIHITGRQDYSRALAFYKDIKNNKIIKAFSWQMPLLYSAADLVVCRSGALTLPGLSFYNLPALLIPHPQAGGHQESNAALLGEREAALVFKQDDFNFTLFEDCLEKMLWNISFRSKIKNNLAKIKLHSGGFNQKEEFMKELGVNGASGS